MAGPTLDELAQRLGIPLSDPEAIRQAFVHSSYFNENAASLPGHNERLEFLGDAVIGLVVSGLLYERFPADDEGHLTARRAGLVNRESLAKLALEMGIDQHMLLGRGEGEAGGARRPSVLAAAFEALAGAVYLSEGLDATRSWLRELLDTRLRGSELHPPKSAKSRFQEWAQRRRQQKPRYQLLEVTGPPHDQRFRVAAMLNDAQLATGEGRTRQRAEEHAAEAALAVVEAPQEPSGAGG